MRSNSGEFSFMTDHYAGCGRSAARFACNLSRLRGTADLTPVDVRRLDDTRVDVEPVDLGPVDLGDRGGLKRRHAGPGADHTKIERGFHPREPAGAGRIPPA